MRKKVAITLAMLMLSAFARAQSPSRPIVPDVPAITYCEMLKNRKQYVDKKISVDADMKLPWEGKDTDPDKKGVVLVRGAEGGEYFYDPECDGAWVKSLRVSGWVGTGFAPGADTSKLRKQLAQLREDRFAERARVQAVGFLREEHGDDNYPYRYRFDIAEFKSFQQVILPFQGELEQSWIYSDTFDYDADEWVIKLSQPFKRPNNMSVRIQWKNEKDFSAELKNKWAKAHRISGDPAHNRRCQIQGEHLLL